MAEKRDEIGKPFHAETSEEGGSEQEKKIMGDIRETRSQMGETIDSIQDRLSFSNLSEQVTEHVNTAVESAKDAVYNATIGKATIMVKNVSNTAAVRTIKNNPLPFGLIGLGAGLLAYKAFAGAKQQSRDNGRAEFRGDETQSPGLMEKVSTRANEALGLVSEKADTAYQGANELMTRAYDRAGEFSDQARAVYDQYIDENPLAVGALAIAVGAVVGLAIPSTRYEGELLGDYRDDLIEKAQDKASGLLDKTKQLVSEQIGTQTEH